MKKIFKIVLMTCSMFFVSSVFADGANLLVNGCFESGLTGWNVVIAGGTSWGTTGTGGTWLYAKPAMPPGSTKAFFAQVYTGLAIEFELYQDFENPIFSFCELSFYHTMRHSGSPQTVTVYLDDTPITTYLSPSNAYFTRFSTNIFVTAGQHRIRFYGTGTGDRTAIIDAVVLEPIYTDNALQVVGDPLDLGTVSPAYGYHSSYAEDETVACSAPASLNLGSTNCTCSGYTLAYLDLLTGLATNTITEGSSNSFDYVHGLYARQLTWHWTASSYTIVVTNPIPEGGTISTNGGLYAPGATFSVTATPATGYDFLRWRGNFDEALATNSTLTFEVTGSANIFPIFLPAGIDYSTYFVANDGDDGNTGLHAIDPFATIIRALSFAEPGDYIRLADGVYPQDSSLYFTNGIHVVGNPDHPGNVVVRRNGPYYVAPAFRVMYVSNSVVSGVAIENGFLNVSSANGAGAYGYDAVFSNCLVRMNFSNTHAYGTGLYLAGNSYVCNTTFTSNTCSSGEPKMGVGLYGTASVVATNCLVIRNFPQAGGSVAGSLKMYNSRIVDNISSVISVNSITGAITLGANCGRAHGTGVSGGNYFNCEITGNVTLKTQYSGGAGGAGANGATLYNCLIASNSIANPTGGGAVNCTLYNCLVIDNFAALGVGACSGSTLYNCTVVDNYGPSVGGIAGGNAYNTILWGNTNVSGVANYSGVGTMAYCCSTPLASGSGNIIDSPNFKPDFSIAFSACVDGGLESHVIPAYASLPAYGGNARKLGVTVDIGCYERTPLTEGEIGVNITCDSPVACLGAPKIFTAIPYTSSPDPIYYSWNFGDGSARVNTTALTVSHTYTEFGIDAYTVSVTASQGVQTASAMYNTPISVLHANTTLYVATNGLDTGVGTSWETALATIPTALKFSDTNVVIRLADGTYPQNATLEIKPTISIVGNVAHPERVIVRRNGQYYSGASFRIFYLNGSSLAGITAENGFSSGYTFHGCGAYLNDSKVSNCIFRSNFSSDNVNGAGVYLAGSSQLTDSVISNNCSLFGDQYVGSGIAASSANCIVSNCVVTRNYTPGGGAIKGAITVFNSRITDNISCANIDAINKTTAAVTVNATTGCRSSGGGVVSGTYYNCVIANNRMRKGGVYNGAGGGGAYNATLHNCLVVGNSSPYVGGGGTYGCTLVNCTVTENDGLASGGVYGGTAKNSIIWDNTISGSSETTPTNNYNSTANLTYACTAPAVADSNSMCAPPLFRGRMEQHGWEAYQLSVSSPCVNAGDDGVVVTGLDLAGNPRLVKRVDLGCYECNRQKGLTVIVR